MFCIELNGNDALEEDRLLKGDNKRELAQQKIKLRVYNAFLQLLDETGYDGITATDIIKRSGVARSTFYRHFSSVHDVLMQYGGHFDELFEAKTSGQTPDFFDREYLVKTFSYYRDMRCEFDIMREAGLPTQWVDLIARYHEDKLGIMPVGSAKRYPLYYFAGAICSVVSEWMASGMRESPEELADIFLKIAQAQPEDLL